MDKGFPVAIVMLALVAAFLLLRLRSVLGKRTGFERPPLPEQPSLDLRRSLSPVIDGIAEPVRPKPGRPIPAPHTVVGQALARIAAADPRFEPVSFLDQAVHAFEQIVTAFASGDLPLLQSLLTPPVYTTFEQAITARHEAGDTQITRIKAIVEATIDEADIIAGHAAIVVRIISDQENFTRNAQNIVIAGSESVVEMIDLWTFERTLNSADPAWRLAAARSG
jgi:predicted lipid-binding transport protein (Tim44 family)